MKLVIQRVSHASVTVDNKIVSSIKHGFMVLVGIGKNDTQNDLETLCQKMVKLRVFPDDDGKMNRSIQDAEGQILLVSQFTLYANGKKGNRPSFVDAMPPQEADELFNSFVAMAEKEVEVVKTGVFGAYMKVTLTNEGPTTIILES